MALLLQCACGKKLSVRDELAGKKVKCPGCGQVIVAPKLTVIDRATELIAGEPPPKVDAKKTDEETAITEEPRVRPAWDDDKAKTAAKLSDDVEKDDDDREEEEDEDKPGPHWVFPGTLSTEVMALGREGIWFASLKGDVLKTALRKLKNGSQPGQVLGEKAYYIPWVALTSIFCNRKLNGFTISYKNAGEAATKIMTPANREERDEIMKAIENFMKPDVKRTVNKHTPVTAMASPLIAIAVTFAITIGVAILSLCIGGDWEGKGRGAALAALFNFLDWIGPLGSCGIGALCGGFFVLWMFVRMLNPPIEVTLTPVASRASDEED